MCSSSLIHLKPPSTLHLIHPTHCLLHPNLHPSTPFCLTHLCPTNPTNPNCSTYLFMLDPSHPSILCLFNNCACPILICIIHLTLHPFLICLPESPSPLALNLYIKCEIISLNAVYVSCATLVFGATIHAYIGNAISILSNLWNCP